jgi:nucleotide-binding universal stress UspA family protein
MNEMSKNISSGTVLVPVDFSAVSEEAVLSGMMLAGLMDASLTLLHVLTETETDLVTDRRSLVKKTLKHYALLVEQQGIQIGVRMKATVQPGNLFTVIGRAERRLKPSVIVMGTHGKRGLQHLFGSHALRVVVDADCPVLVIQERFDPHNLSGNIIVPEFSETPCQGLADWIIRIAGIHGREVVLVNMSNDRLPMIPSGRFSRVAGLQDRLAAEGVNIRKAEVDPGEDPALQILELARREGAHLIMSRTMTDDPAAGLSYLRWNEKLMFNQAQVPVMFFSGT